MPVEVQVEKIVEREVPVYIDRVVYQEVLLPPSRLVLFLSFLP